MRCRHDDQLTHALVIWQECNERDLHWDRFFLPVPPFVGFYGDKVKFTKHHLKNTARKPDKRYSDMHERPGDRHVGYYDNGAHDRRYPDNNRNWGYVKVPPPYLLPFECVRQ
jgi:hypothetical protein